MASELRIIILRLLQEYGELYGLELVEKSGGLLKRGSVYVTLDRMEDEGLIESRLKMAKQGQQGPPRRVYKITGFGVTSLREAMFKFFATGIAPGGV